MQITIDNGHVRCKKDAQVLPAACRIHDLPNTAERILRRCTRSGFILGTLAASTLPARAQPRARIRIGVVPTETSAQALPRRWDSSRRPGSMPTSMCSFLFGTWFTMSQWAKDHPDLVARFSTAIREAGLWADANRSKSAQILARVTIIDPTIVDSMVRARYADRTTPAMMQPEIDIASNYGDFPPFAARDMIYQLDRSSGTSERH
jgi:hypothetical protein